MIAVRRSVWALVLVLALAYLAAAVLMSLQYRWVLTWPIGLSGAVALALFSDRVLILAGVRTEG